jgi:hypothetical protein
MVFIWLAAWAVDAALYLAGMKERAFHAASILIVISIPWVLLAVVVSFLEMRNAARKARKET